MAFFGVHIASPLGALIGLVMAAGVLGIYQAYVRLVERRAVAELAPAGLVRYSARGILIGAGLFCATMLLLRLAGAWSYAGLTAPAVLVYPFVGSVVAAIQEEILIRGLLFRILEESLGSWTALAISAAIFGLLHAFNPGASVVSTAAIALEAGVLLAAAYMYTRSLWFVMGLHFGWNFSEGGVFATSVSGGKTVGVIGVTFAGPDLLTGGKFGPEASLLAVLICLAAGIAFIILARRSGRVMKPFWKRQ